jgi:hypothetical protein
MEGFWIVQFEGMEGRGAGVIVLLRNHIYGGDSGCHYTGTYTDEAGQLSAEVLVHEFLQGTGNVLGIEGDFRLALKGKIVEGIVEGTARLVGQAGVGLAFKLKKISDLS